MKSLVNERLENVTLPVPDVLFIGDSMLARWVTTGKEIYEEKLIQRVRKNRNLIMI